MCLLMLSLKIFSLVLILFPSLDVLKKTLNNMFLKLSNAPIRQNLDPLFPKVETYETVEYCFPVKPERVQRTEMAIAPDFKTVALTVSYQSPHLSEVLFINVDTGVHISSSLRGAECRVYNFRCVMSSNAECILK